MENKENENSVTENIDSLVEESRKDKIKKEIIEWVKSLICAGLISIFIMTFICFFAKVPTGSMIPTIPENSKILVLKFLRYFDWENRGLSCGDIVVFHFNQNGESKLLVKRVIGMPGDIIRIDNGVVYRNDEVITEPYVKNKDSFFMDEYVVEENEIFVLGDNRTNSYDCRYWKHKGVPLKDVVGEALFID